MGSIPARNVFLFVAPLGKNVSSTEVFLYSYIPECHDEGMGPAL